jgi:hypothetical protein
MRAGRKVPICWGATGLAAKGLWRKEEQGGWKRDGSGGDTGCFVETKRGPICLAAWSDAPSTKELGSVVVAEYL